MTDEELIARARLAQRYERNPTGALFSDLADRIEELTAKLAKAEKAIKSCIHWSAGGLYCNCWECAALVTTLAEIKGESHE